jgi:RNAse (barnase) inhibitor barstar
MKQRFTFSAEATPDGFVATLGQPIHSQEDLYRELATALHFPDYFGKNWDALLDCLSDLSWIADYNVTLIHTACPKLPAADLGQYIGVLDSALDRWDDARHREHHALAVVFPAGTEQTILSLL